MKSAYTYSITTAMILSILMLSGCSGNKKSTLHMEQQRTAQLQVNAETQALIDKTKITIDQLIERARFENPETTALEQLHLLSQDITLPAPSRGHAAFKHAELLFEFEQIDAFTFMESALKQWPDHQDAPQAHLFLAQQWNQIGNSEGAISELTAALAQPNIDPHILSQVIEIAGPLLSYVSEESSIQWLLTVSLHDVKNRELWLQQAAKYSTLEHVLQLRQSDQPLQREQANFYRYAARERLMVGDYHAVRMIAKILDLDMPDSEAADIVKKWAKSEGELNVVGVLLPLSGKYAAYGQQALEGIRLALSKPEFEGNIILRIQDTAGEKDQTISGYHQLLSQGVQWIIGPLLSDNTAALAPYLVENLPVIALSNQVELASSSPALFIHSLAKTVQADFMAHYAIKQGKKRMVIIHDHLNSAIDEAASFAKTFIDAGGEIIDIVEMKEGVYDNRPDLVAMRSRTDDEELFASLESDLYLFSPELEIDIKLPLNMDGIYIVATGKQLAVLAGQMAYADISKTQFYGSYRWFDGHLMDDDGRYLTGAEFATPITSLPQPDQAILDVQNQYRVIWAKDNEITPLSALAYDTAMNIGSLGTRLGLKGQDAIKALRNTTEFPAISGNYYFDRDGISQKTFAIQHINRGRIKTVQAAL